MQFTKVSKVKDNMVKVYKECNDIQQEKRTLLETFLKEEFSKHYDIAFDLFQMTEKIKHQISAKII